MDCIATRACPSCAMLCAASRVNPTCGVKPGNDSGSLILLFHLQRQAHRLPGGGRALDGDRRLQIDARLLGRGMDRGRAGCEMIEPGARLVAERTPESPTAQSPAVLLPRKAMSTVWSGT